MTGVYHLDWICGSFSLLGMYVVGRKLWWGWLINAVNTCMLVYINVHFQLWGFLPVNALMIALFVRNAYKWKTA
jgi:hypothetical protein